MSGKYHMPDDNINQREINFRYQCFLKASKQFKQVSLVQFTVCFIIKPFYYQ